MNRWKILAYMGGAMPKPNVYLRRHIRGHLQEHYCPTCGEYMYNVFPNRTVRHHHVNILSRFRYILYERVLVNYRLMLIEWERHFPRVLRLVLSEEEIRHGIRKVRSPRIPSVRVWTLDEWDLFYPDHKLMDGMKRMMRVPIENVLFTPDLAFY